MAGDEIDVNRTARAPGRATGRRARFGLPGLAHARAVVSVLVVAAVTAACGASADTSGSPATRMNAWTAATSITSLDAQLPVDVTHIHTLASLWLHHGGSSRELATDCVVLGNDVRQANQVLPSPDQVLTDELATAYSTLIGGAEACYKAAEAGDANGATTSLSTIDAGLRGLAVASARLSALSPPAGARPRSRSSG